MSPRRLVLVVIAVASLTATPPRSIQAQVVDTAVRLEPGRRVRVTPVERVRALRSPYREGVFARLAVDSIHIVRPRGDTLGIARAEARRVEVLVRAGSRPRRLFVGAAIGVVGGGMLGVALGGSAGGCGDLPGCTSSVDTARSFMAGAAIGGAIGLLAAAATSVHRWRVVPDF